MSPSIHQVLVPLLNANEDEVLVTSIPIKEGEHVVAGQYLCSLESTKASSDIEAPVSGFVRRILVSEESRVKVGRVICIITESQDTDISALTPSGPNTGSGDVKATRKASLLAEQEGIDLACLGHSGIIREEDVRRYMARQATHEAAPIEPDPPGRISQPLEIVDTRPMLILGMGGHAKVMIDLVRCSYPDRSIVAAVDDSPSAGEDVMGVPRVGGSNELEQLRAEGIRSAILGVGAVTHNATRITLYSKLRQLGFELPSLIHTKACVEDSVTMGSGNQIFAGAVIGSAARLGDNTIINSGAVVSHDCDIGSHTHITPGAILAGGVSVGENTVIGMGATVYLGVSIGNNVVISNGVHVMKDVPDGSLIKAH